MAKRTTVDLTEGSVIRRVLQFALPMLMWQYINSLYNTADTVMMGRFAGTNAMAAVGASSHPLTLIVNAVGTLSIGVNVCCGNLIGAKKQKELQEAMHTSVSFGLVLGLVVGVLGMLLCEPLLRSLDTPQEILADAVLYMRIRLAGGPLVILSAFMNQIFYAHGNTQLPTVTGLISGLINVGLNALFVLGLGMGVAGVALATVISQALSVVAKFAVLFSPKGIYQLSVKKLRLQLVYIKESLTVGLPNALNQVITSYSNVLLQSAINSFGPLVLAGSTAASNIGSFVTTITTVLASATLAASAQCYGAKKYKRIDETIRATLLVCTVVISSMAAILTWKGKELLLLYDGNPQVAEFGYVKLMFFVWGYLIHNVAIIFAAGLKGIRKAKTALLCNGFATIVIRFLWIWLVIPQMHTPVVLYMIYPISWSISAVAMVVLFTYYRRKMDAALEAV